MNVERTKPPLICVTLLGPTASGKSKLALELAQRIGAEIVSMDSTSVYRGFDIGSSKPSHEDREKIPHHLIDVLAPEEGFSAFHFVQRAEEIIEEIAGRGKIPLIVGGTYFYLRALQHGMYPAPVIPAEVIERIEREYFEDDKLNTVAMHRELSKNDPKAAAVIHPNDRYRLLRALALLRTTGSSVSDLKPAVPESRSFNWTWLKYAIALPRKTLHNHIVQRTDQMLTDGLVDETKVLFERFPRSRALGSIGYSEAVQFLKRQITLKQLRSEILEKTRQLAKRQMTWLRSDTELRFVGHDDIDRIFADVDGLRTALGSSLGIPAAEGRLSEPLPISTAPQTGTESLCIQ